MIDNFFIELMNWNPIYWAALILLILILFKLIKNLGKIFIFLLIILFVLYAFYYYNPEVISEKFDEIIESIDLWKEK